MLSLGSFRAGRPDAFIHLTVPEPARFVQRNLSGGRLHGHLRLVNKYEWFWCWRGARNRGPRRSTLVDLRQLNDKPVFRVGGGVFYERIATFCVGITSNYTTNPPLLRTAQIYYGNLSTIQSTGGTFFPATITRLSSDHACAN